MNVHVIAHFVEPPVGKTYGFLFNSVLTPPQQDSLFDIEKGTLLSSYVLDEQHHVREMSAYVSTFTDVNSGQTASVESGSSYFAYAYTKDLYGNSSFVLHGNSPIQTQAQAVFNLVTPPIEYSVDVSADITDESGGVAFAFVLDGDISVGSISNDWNVNHGHLLSTPIQSDSLHTSMNVNLKAYYKHDLSSYAPLPFEYDTNYYIYIYARDVHANESLTPSPLNPIRFNDVNHTFVTAFTKYLISEQSLVVSQGRLKPQEPSVMEFDDTDIIVTTQHGVSIPIHIEPMESVVDKMNVLLFKTYMGFVPNSMDKTKMIEIKNDHESISTVSMANPVLFDQKQTIAANIRHVFMDDDSPVLFTPGETYSSYAILHDQSFDVDVVQFSGNVTAGFPPIIDIPYIDVYTNAQHVIDWNETVASSTLSFTSNRNESVFENNPYQYTRVVVGASVTFNVGTGYSLFASDVHTSNIARTDNEAPTQVQFQTVGLFAFNSLSSHTSALLVVEVVHQHLFNAPIDTSNISTYPTGLFMNTMDADSGIASTSVSTEWHSSRLPSNIQHLEVLVLGYAEDITTQATGTNSRSFYHYNLATPGEIMRASAPKPDQVSPITNVSDIKWVMSFEFSQMLVSSTKVYTIATTQTFQTRFTQMDDWDDTLASFGANVEIVNAINGNQDGLLILSNGMTGAVYTSVHDSGSVISMDTRYTFSDERLVELNLIRTDILALRPSGKGLGRNFQSVVSPASGTRLNDRVFCFSGRNHLNEVIFTSTDWTALSLPGTDTVTDHETFMQYFTLVSCYRHGNMSTWGGVRCNRDLVFAHKATGTKFILSSPSLTDFASASTALTYNVPLSSSTTSTTADWFRNNGGLNTGYVYTLGSGGRGGNGHGGHGHIYGYTDTEEEFTPSSALSYWVSGGGGGNGSPNVYSKLRYVEGNYSPWYAVNYVSNIPDSEYGSTYIQKHIGAYHARHGVYPRVLRVPTYGYASFGLMGH